MHVQRCFATSSVSELDQLHRLSANFGRCGCGIVYVRCIKEKEGGSELPLGELLLYV